jgi:hypothetical protein
MLSAAIAGIDRSRVEDMEARLKRDVLREAARYEQHILVTEEDDDMNVSTCRGSAALQDEQNKYMNGKHVHQSCVL